MKTTQLIFLSIILFSLSFFASCDDKDDTPSTKPVSITAPINFSCTTNEGDGNPGNNPVEFHTFSGETTININDPKFEYIKKSLGDNIRFTVKSATLKIKSNTGTIARNLNSTSSGYSLTLGELRLNSEPIAPEGLAKYFENVLNSTSLNGGTATIILTGETNADPNEKLDINLNVAISAVPAP